MKTFRWLSWLSVVILILGGQTSGVFPANWQDKVDPRALQDIGAGIGEFILFLDEQADLSGAERLATKAEKGRYVYERLTALAQRTQAPLLDHLDALAKAKPGQVEYRPFWVANMIWVRGDQQTLQTLAQQPEVAQVYANPEIQSDLPEPQLQPPDAPNSPAGPETVMSWGLTKVKAPEVWALGITGQGVVIGGQDTGYAWEHPALKGKYRGWNGSSADHNYNWHDAIHDGLSSCPPDSPAPCDDQQHGTHTMGTMVGDDGQGKQIGVAPGARWIGCRNMREGVGTPATYAECYQWFIAPTDLNGQNPRTDLAPDVINNSWSCPTEEGCNDKQVLLATVNAVRSAGIVTVHSAGNEGSQCGTIQNPAAIYDASFTVGNTNEDDQMSSNSSRGPVTVDGSNRLKPDVSAPGTNIYSSIPYYYPPGSYSYTTMSGTSMAGPHVAGLVALLISASPTLRGNVGRIEDLIRLNAQPLSLLQNQVCGGTAANQIPNNIFGWGRIDALETIRGIGRIELRKTVSSQLYAPGDELTYTLWFTHTHQTTPTTNVVVTDTLPAGVDFVSASVPYDRVGNLVSWQFPTLDPGEAGSVQLVVEIPQVPASQVTNAAYGVGSDDFSMTSPPPPVISYLAINTLHLPLLFR